MLKLSLRILCGPDGDGAEIAMGPGKAHLLEAIAAAGSISGAARSLGMSYRRAWLLVDAMNRCWDRPLVATTPGAARGTGARLTPLGDEVLAVYRAAQAAAAEASAQAAAPLVRRLRTAPLPRRDKD